MCNASRTLEKVSLELENAANEIVSGVRAFEGNGIDTGVFPNYIGAPNECHKDIDKKIDRKKISEVIHPKPTVDRTSLFGPQTKIIVLWWQHASKKKID